jgi:hypothetical protein
MCHMANNTKAPWGAQYCRAWTFFAPPVSSVLSVSSCFQGIAKKRNLNAEIAESTKYAEERMSGDAQR